MISISLLHLATLLAFAAANPLTRRTMAVHEQREGVPAGFVHVGPVPSEKITLRIALANTDIAGLEAKTYAVSDPASALYGQHLTAAEVAEYVKPTTDTLSAVTEWLNENDLVATAVSPSGDLLQISLAINKANELLSTEFSAFKHVATGAESIRTLAYSIPASLQAHVKFVHPTIAFVPPLRGLPGVTAVNHKRAEPTADAIPASCAFDVTPACLQAMYDIPAAKATNSANSGIVVTGFNDEYANKADLQRFLNTFRPDLNTSTFDTQLIAGGQNDQTLANAGSEANLDIQYTVGVAGGVPVTFLSVGADVVDDVDGVIDIVNVLLAESDDTRPKVITTSYGFNEPELPQSLNVEICNAYMQLGAVCVHPFSTSVFFASGDGGVGGFQPVRCDTFWPTAPSGCPFITSVGGTDGVPQVAASLSGGGFSNHFTTPAYQADDVASYLSSIGDQYSGLYNTSGRGFPDIALQARNLEIFWFTGGTSASCPIAASLFALINDRLIAAGKPVLGFLNPFLYSTAGRAAFTDITSGTNPGCNTEGFSAASGWDPVTGLGTPNFDLLLTAVGL
ncbi:family S53 protease [Mycena crocata]|nr:family S53 protease [Mycena crocata]